MFPDQAVQNRYICHILSLTALGKMFQKRKVFHLVNDSDEFDVPDRNEVLQYNKRTDRIGSVWCGFVTLLSWAKQILTNKFVLSKTWFAE